MFQLRAKAIYFHSNTHYASRLPFLTVGYSPTSHSSGIPLLVKEPSPKFSELLALISEDGLYIA